MIHSFKEVSIVKIARFIATMIAIPVIGVLCTVFPTDAAARPTTVTVALPYAAPPCIHEDGSGQDFCVWDARVRNNGIGLSFVKVQKGRWVRISHKRAQRIIRHWRAESCVKVAPRKWECWNWDAKG